MGEPAWLYPAKTTKIWLFIRYLLHLPAAQGCQECSKGWVSLRSLLGLGACRKTLSGHRRTESLEDKWGAVGKKKEQPQTTHKARAQLSFLPFKAAPTQPSRKAPKKKMYLFLCSVQHAVQWRGIQVLHCFAHIPAEGIAGWKAAGCENRERRRIPGVKRGIPTAGCGCCSHPGALIVFPPDLCGNIQDKTLSVPRTNTPWGCQKEIFDFTCYF